MEGNFLDFFFYLILNTHKDKEAFIIIFFLVLGSFFSLRLIFKNYRLILKVTSNLIGILFIIFIFFIVVFGVFFIQLD